ncbi:MAG: DUF2630 family protein [Acidimicrobiales bacterium]
MSDDTVLQRIERLVEQERALERSHAGSPATEVQKALLQHIEVELDQCWDLLRQRRARRAAGENPNDATVRSETVVEHYLQ